MKIQPWHLYSVIAPERIHAGTQRVAGSHSACSPQHETSSSLSHPTLPCPTQLRANIEKPFASFSISTTTKWKNTYRPSVRRAWRQERSPPKYDFQFLEFLFFPFLFSSLQEEPTTLFDANPASTLSIGQAGLIDDDELILVNPHTALEQFIANIQDESVHSDVLLLENLKNCRVKAGTRFVILQDGVNLSVIHYTTEERVVVIKIYPANSAAFKPADITAIATIFNSSGATYVRVEVHDNVIPPIDAPMENSFKENEVFHGFS